MPAQPPCFQRLEEIFTALRAMTSTHLDRQAVEKLFRVRWRRARGWTSLSGSWRGYHCNRAPDLSRPLG